MTDFETLEAILQRRHSCRAFLPTPLSRSVIEQILVATQRGASWCNAQPWKVHVVSGNALDNLRAALCARAESATPPAPELDWPREYRGVYQERRRECGWGLYRATGVQKGDREASLKQARENFRMFGAPHVAILTSEKLLGTHGVMDCGAWVANFLLSCTAMGVATIAQAALASYPDILHAHLDIAADRVIVCGISFGYEDTVHPANSFRTTRAPLGEVVSWVD